MSGLDSQKGGIVIIVAAIVIVGAGLVGGLFLVSQNTSWFSQADMSDAEISIAISSPVPSPTAQSTPVPSVEEVYENPFSENAYQNPFEEDYENPFNSL